MSDVSRRLVRTAFACLAGGLALGLCFAVDRPLGVALRPLHVELNVWGFVTLLIYGVALHVVPRFAGRPLRRPRLAVALSYAAPGGVALTSAGWLAGWLRWPAARGVLLAGGAVEAVAAGLFIVVVGWLLWGDWPGGAVRLSSSASTPPRG